MDFLSLFITVVLVSSSGALAPGPLFFANVSLGLDHGAKSGLYFSIGHTLVEFPLILLLSYGLLSALNAVYIKTFIGLAGGVVLIFFGLLQLRSSYKFRSVTLNNGYEKRRLSNPLLIGVLLTGLNPFFIIWWLTVGAQLIYLSLALASILGIFIVFLFHVWIDYAWLIATAYLARRGKMIINSKIYRVILFFFGIVLIYFGIHFILSSITL